MRAIAAMIACVMVLTGCQSAPDLQTTGDGSMPALDFASLTKRSSPNDYLVCPDGLCRNATADRIAPVYPVTADALKSAWLDVIAAQPRVTLVQSDDAARQYTFVQRSAVLRFPDFITVSFLERGPDIATLAIYSRSKYGYSDFGVNRKRVDLWLDALDRQMAKPAS